MIQIVTTGGEIVKIDPFSQRALITGANPGSLEVIQLLLHVVEMIDFNPVLYYFANSIDGLTPINSTVTLHNDVTISLGYALNDDGELVAIADIFSFGQDPLELESAATTRQANAIYRMLLEETGDNTAMYTGSIEYTALNQLNVGNNAHIPWTCNH